jgi:PAS domain S-box-containing protein
MPSRPPSLRSASQIRADAEAELARTPPTASTRSADEERHELQLTAIERRMQNENLLQAQLFFEEHRTRYHYLYELAPIGYLTVDPAGMIKEINLSGARMLGAEREHLLGHGLDDFIAFPDQERWRRQFTRSRADDEALTFDLQLAGRGSASVVQVNCVRARANGESRLYITLTDISERKRVEQAQAQNQAFHQAIINSVCAEIAVLDRAGTITAVNQSWRRFAIENGIEPGRPAPNTEVGTNYLACCSSQTSDGEATARAARAGIEAVLDGRLPFFSLEYPCPSPTRKRWFTMSVTPLRFNGHGVVVSHTDISERKEVEQQLRESEERHRVLVEWSPEGICVHRDGKVLYVNSTALRMFGAESAGQLVGSRLLDRVHPDSIERVLGQIRKVIARPNAMVVTEARYVRFDGAVVDVAVHSVLIDYDGEPAIHCSMRDITERNQREREIAVLRREMEEMMTWQIARHTATALAHEVNQPLASIAALCEGTRHLLSADVGTPATRSHRLEDVLQRLTDESSRAGAVVRDLLESLHAPDARRQSTPLSTLFEEVLQVTHTGRLADCQLLIDCPADLPPVLINLRQVEKALLNLIGNSVEAMHRIGLQRGRIWLVAGRSEAGNSAQVTVHDEGPGISPEVEQQIFHPLIHRQPGNLGMGLAITRTLIETQGGKFWHEKPAGSGAVFHLTLPWAE